MMMRIYVSGSQYLATEVDEKEAQRIMSAFDNRETDREIELENALNAILTHGPACQYDNDCLLNGGNGYDQGCATCACIIAEKALKGKRHEV